MKRTAYLSNNRGYTCFQIGNQVFRFTASPYLERYTCVKEYDGGYLVVDAKYSTMEQPEEDYIDMEYIINELGLNKDILKGIKEVIIKNDKQCKKVSKRG